ncbi:MAG: FtsX-like permease family protein [Candidatus Competibacteraceae bacterium]|nr:FtsX-like permease family protein [Candidatus Competibacteraceae bacterium]
MRSIDLFLFAFTSVRRYPLRTSLLLLAVIIGVVAVILLTALGEGARRYVTGQFSSLGSNLLIVLPGRNETTGGRPPVLGETPRDLTLDDAQALTRSRYVRRIAPLNVGQAELSFGRRSREVAILGSTADFLPVRKLSLAQGQFLPPADLQQAAPVCVLGIQARDELFGPEPALGQWIRIGDRRFRVIGILASTGQSLGADIDNIAVIPVAAAQRLFNTASLFRILVEVNRLEDLKQAEQAIQSIIRDRHEGEDDVTIITQGAVLETFNRIFLALTLALAGIAAISLVVAGILIMNVTLVSVSQRTEEIGLLKALGATPRVIRLAFLTEAGLLSLAGAILGLMVAQAGIWIGRWLFPTFPLAAPLWAIIAAVSVAVSAGLLFALLPARRAARLDPVQALAGR